MPEIRPVVNNIGSNDRLSASNRQNHQDPFSITGETVPTAKVTPQGGAEEAQNQMQQARSGLLSELSQGLMKPINEKTNIQSGELRELVAATRILEASSDKMSQSLQEKIFISPEQLQQRLMTQDKGETSFSGSAFDVLRLLAKASSGTAEGGSSAAELAKLLINMNGKTMGGAQSASGAAANAMMQAMDAGAQAAELAGMQGQAAGSAEAASVESAYAQMLAQLAEEGAVTGLSASDEAAAAAGAQTGEAADAAAAGNAANAEATAGKAATAGTANAGAAAESRAASQTQAQGLAGSLSEAVAGKQLTAEGQNIQNSVVTILRHFDCYTNQDQSLQAISSKLAELEGRIFKSDRPLMQNLIENLSNLMKETGGVSDGKTNPYSQVQNMLQGTDIMKADEEGMAKTQAFLKDQLVPELSKLLAKYNQAEGVRDPITTIIHYVARYDKADPTKLSRALDNMGEALLNVQNFTEEDVAELKTLILDAAKDIRVEQKVANVEKDFLARFGASADEKGDIASFLSQSLDKDSPAGVQKLAMNLLNTMVDNESPTMPLMHFMVPIDYNGSNTYLEMYVDKECEGRKGKADSAVNIFFTIESEDYGTFEVDLLERDGMIDLDIKAPAELQRDIRQARANIRSAVEESGFRLALYRVGAYSESTSAASHFKDLKKQKVGMDIKA